MSEPYVVTVKRGGDVVSRRAVATGGDVRDLAHSFGARYTAQAHLDCVLHGESRAPVELPDGTVIEVTPVDWTVLGWHMGWAPKPQTARMVIDAYNEAQEVKA